MIESPDALFEPLPTIDPDSDNALDSGIAAEPVALKQQTISSSFRRTVKHLTAKGGFTARFRGFSIFIVNAFLVGLISGPISAIPFIPPSVAGAISTIILANLSLAWTHIVISEPSTKRWYRRVPGLRAFKKIVAPTAVLALAKELSVLLPLLFAKIYNFGKLREDAPNMSGGRTVVIGLEALSVLAFGIVLSFFLVLPAKVALTRVQACLLDDSEETIVPFDRTFGGKVVPEIVGGTGVISMIDAWKTFDWAARVRLVKTYAKLLVLETLVVVAFIAVIVIEFFVIAHADLKKVFPGDGNTGGKDL